MKDVKTRRREVEPHQRRELALARISVAPGRKVACALALENTYLNRGFHLTSPHLPSRHTSLQRIFNFASLLTLLLLFPLLIYNRVQLRSSCSPASKSSDWTIKVLFAIPRNGTLPV